MDFNDDDTLRLYTGFTFISKKKVINLYWRKVANFLSVLVMIDILPNLERMFYRYLHDFYSYFLT